MKAMPYIELELETSEPVRGPTRLKPATVYAIFVCWTLFAVFLYSRYSQLGDAKSYLTGVYGDDAQARTQFVTLLATRLIGLLHSELLTHLAFSLFAATGVAFLANEARVRARYRWPLLAVLLIPHFGVWSSVLGRESLFVGLLGFFMGAVVGYARDGGFLRLLFAMACVGGMVFIRAPFGVGIALFFAMYLLYMWGPRVGLSVGVQFLALMVIGALVLMFAWQYVDDYIAVEVLPKARSYFTISSESTRLWVNIDTTPKLFKSLWWALPLALIGPTPGEVMARPVMLPFLASGLVVCGLLLHQTRVAFRAPAGVPRKILVLGWLPAMAVLLVSYVPFGVYNAGSGIRYASCFILFIILPSMLVSALTWDDATRGPLPGGRPMPERR